MLNSRTPPWTLLLLLALLAGCGGDEVPDEEPPTPEATPEPTPEPTPTPLPWVESQATVRSGQVITAILQGQGLEYADALALVNAASGIHDLAKIRAGEDLTFRTDRETGALLAVVYPLDRYGERRLVVARGEAGWEASEDARDTTIEIVGVAGIVNHSLWGACETLGLKAETIVGLAGIFEWEIDFNTQIRQGDSFRMLVESVKDAATGEHLRHGRILGAEFTSSGTTFQGFRFEGRDDHVGYFNAEGMSSKKMFLKSPLKFSRISSNFSRKRYHPILKKWRSHNGTDYAAGAGTPVRSIGRGTVSFSGTKGGYGKHVRVKHNGKYSSSYSHLSKRAVTQGQVVDQGQLIGYVGSTGLATGPHLHFEFYVDGKYSDFQRQTFPRTEPISEAERPAFEAVRDALVPQLLAVPLPGEPTGDDDDSADPGEDATPPG
jgi:murein DD-endopeptidase MepM/ murein hydrolase activator NlpD